MDLTRVGQLLLGGVESTGHQVDAPAAARTERGDQVGGRGLHRYQRTERVGRAEVDDQLRPRLHGAAVTQPAGHFEQGAQRLPDVLHVLALARCRRHHRLTQVGETRCHLTRGDQAAPRRESATISRSTSRWAWRGHGPVRCRDSTGPGCLRLGLGHGEPAGKAGAVADAVQQRSRPAEPAVGHRPGGRGCGTAATSRSPPPQRPRRGRHDAVGRTPGADVEWRTPGHPTTTAPDPARRAPRRTRRLSSADRKASRAAPHSPLVKATSPAETRSRASICR